MNDTLINYQPINQLLLDDILHNEANIRDALINGYIKGLELEHGVINNTEDIYNFSMVDLKTVFNLSAALEDYNTLPEMARRFVIYKIEDIISTILYNNEPVAKTDADLLIFDKPIPENIIEELIVLQTGTLITKLGITIYYVLYLPETSTLEYNEEDLENFTVIFDLEHDPIRYYKYNTQLNNFQEIFVERETQLGAGRLDIYLDMAEQAADTSAIEYTIQNRKSIVAAQQNQQPVLDSTIDFDTGSLWFIKTIESSV